MTVTLPEEFISNFHSLEGVTIAERRKNLFHLLNKTSRTLQSVSSETSFVSLRPKTPLEENFKTETLIFFKEIPELVEILKCENPILIEKVLKIGSWFIEEAFGNLNGEQLATQIFPSLSYTTKLKLLNKLTAHLNNTQKADEYFEAIKGEYGIYLASKLLPACSTNLIMKYIESHRLEITPRHLLNIIKKNPSLTRSIFEKLKLYNSEVELAQKYRNVFIYLIQHDISLFLAMLEKYKPEFRLGARATVTLINAQKQVILKNPRKLYDFLKTNQIYKSMKQDFKVFFHNLLPKSLQQFGEKIDDYMLLLDDIVSKAEKADIVLTAARKVYGEELCNNPSFIMPKLIYLMTQEDREAWINVNARPKDVTESTWLSFMKTDKSIPMLKEKFSKASTFKQRADLIACLVKTCDFNDDKTALSDVLEFMLKHRNDHLAVHRSFINTFGQLFKLQKLESEHWNILDKYLRCFMLNNSSCWWIHGVSECYIYYCLENKLPVTELLIEWLKSTRNEFNICGQKQEHEKNCLLIFNEIIPTTFTDDELNDGYVGYLGALVSFNKRHPKDKISLFINDSAIGCIRSNLEKNDYAYQEELIAISCVLSDYEKSKETNLLHAVLNRKESYNKTKLILWLVRKRPMVILDYIEPIMDSILKLYFLPVNLNSWFRNYTHLGIPQKLSEICTKTINTPDKNLKKRKMAGAILSYTMNSEDYLNFVASLKPSEVLPDIESDEGQKIYKTFQAILPNLTNVIPISSTTDCIFTLCKGDYVKLLVPSLYSATFNINETKVISFLDTLNKLAVSARKHSILIAFKTLNQTQARKLLLQLTANEKNSSVLRNILKATFSFFVGNPDDYSWGLTQSCLKQVKRDDEESLKMLTKRKKIPSQYCVEYAQVMWSILEEFTELTDAITEAKCNILDILNARALASAPKDFCIGIIERYFLKSGERSEFEKAIDRFTCRYIIYCKVVDDQKECLNIVFERLKEYVTATWYNLDKNVVGRKTVFCFVQEFCADFLAKECSDTKVIQMFINKWNDFLKPREAFDEYIYLQFASIFVDSLNESAMLSFVGKKLALLCDDLQKNESIVTSIFCEMFVNIFIDYFLSTDADSDRVENKINLIEGILETSKSSSSLALIIALLPTDIIITPQTKTRYNNIIQSLMDCRDHGIQIRLHNYLRNKSD